jgi:hypothetical protein
MFVVDIAGPICKYRCTMTKEHRQLRTVVRELVQALDTNRYDRDELVTRAEELVITKAQIAKRKAAFEAIYPRHRK